MKRNWIYLFSAVLMTTVLFSVSANEQSAVWSRIYDTSTEIEARYSVMQNIVDLHDRDMEPVITDALREIIYSGDLSASTSDRLRSDDLVRLMVAELGSLKASDAAADIYYVMKNTDDEFLRAAAITALGNAGARDYADEISQHLNYINSEIILIENNEKRRSVINACILALERLKHPVGFEPVFFTSIGRYARDSVKQAERALQNMVEDPTDLIIEIIKDDNTFATRLAALEVEEKSSATAERQTEAATAAIEVSLVYNAQTPAEKQFQTRTKVKSAEMIRDLGAANENAIQWLGIMLNSSTVVNEIIISLQALGTYSSDSAVDVLNTYLKYHNDRRASGLQYKDERAIRACINALGNTGNPNAKESLMAVEFSNWSSQTIRMAKTAMKDL